MKAIDKRAVGQRGLQGNRSKLRKGSILNEDNFEPRQNFIRGQNFPKTILHQGSILHELQFCTEGHFYTREKKQK